MSECSHLHSRDLLPVHHLPAWRCLLFGALNRQVAAAEAETSFLRERVACIFEWQSSRVQRHYREVDALDSRRGRRVYMPKYNAKRRELNRIKEQLKEKSIYIKGVETTEEEENLISSLIAMANESTGFLAS